MELKIENISKYYGSKCIIDHVSFVVENGIYALLGPNGAGKTTLISILVGALKQTSGNIFCNEKNVNDIKNEYASYVGFMPQQVAYYKNFTAVEFLCYVGILKGMTHKEATQRAIELLRKVNLLNEKDKKIRTFSGGMKQRLGIAQSLMNEPKILVFDEPTAGLDPRERIRFRNILSKLSKDIIVIISTHIVPDVDEIADHIILIKQGKILRNAKPLELTMEQENKIWNICASYDTLDEIMHKYRIFNINHVEDEYILRVYSDKKPCENAVNVPPTLEDVYLYYYEEVNDDAFSL